MKLHLRKENKRLVEKSRRDTCRINTPTACVLERCEDEAKKAKPSVRELK